MPVEVARARAEETASFVRGAMREALQTFYGFNVVWHEQLHDFAARDGESVVGAARVRVAASLAHVEFVVVAPAYRMRGVGRQLLESAAEVANYYNCHKMTALVPRGSGAQRFFERCGYHSDAVLPQHTFKLDMTVLRKFLL